MPPAHGQCGSIKRIEFQQAVLSNTAMLSWERNSIVGAVCIDQSDKCCTNTADIVQETSRIADILHQSSAVIHGGLYRQPSPWQITSSDHKVSIFCSSCIPPIHCQVPDKAFKELTCRNNRPAPCWKGPTNFDGFQREGEHSLDLAGTISKSVSTNCFADLPFMTMLQFPCSVMLESCIMMQGSYSPWEGIAGTKQPSCNQSMLQFSDQGEAS